MVTCCAVHSCNYRQNKIEKIGLFRIPAIQRGVDKKTLELLQDRRRVWIERINRKNLTAAQLSAENSTLRVCGKHFISGKIRCFLI